MKDEIKNKVRGFLAKNKKIGELSDGDDLFEKGFVNSLFALQLIMFLEKEFKIKIPDKAINEDNFRSVDAIAVTVSAVVNNETI
ncbi:MAG: phosphopantetheine-binding protein [Clostridiales Family XIII bacterium]|jgi:acyl carrier protein|nr:phosphopantetheine-binding protein [Clostridiales Family XIII bacterium]